MARKGKILSSIVAKKSRSHSSKAGLQFSVGCIARILKIEKYVKHVGAGAPVFLAAMLEYLVDEVLELVENSGRDNKEGKNHSKAYSIG